VSARLEKTNDEPRKPSGPRRSAIYRPRTRPFLPPKQVKLLTDSAIYRLAKHEKPRENAGENARFGTTYPAFDEGVFEIAEPPVNRLVIHGRWA
jgi:hypothetical protein